MKNIDKLILVSTPKKIKIERFENNKLNPIKTVETKTRSFNIYLVKKGESILINNGLISESVNYTEKKQQSSVYVVDRFIDSNDLFNKGYLLELGVLKCIKYTNNGKDENLKKDLHQFNEILEGLIIDETKDCLPCLDKDKFLKDSLNREIADLNKIQSPTKKFFKSLIK